MKVEWSQPAREDLVQIRAYIVREQGAGALLIVAGDIPTAVAEYPDNVEPNTQISKAPAPFFHRPLVQRAF